MIGSWCSIHRAEARCQGVGVERAWQGCLDVTTPTYSGRDEGVIRRRGNGNETIGVLALEATGNAPVQKLSCSMFIGNGETALMLTFLCTYICSRTSSFFFFCGSKDALCTYITITTIFT